MTDLPTELLALIQAVRKETTHLAEPWRFYRAADGGGTMVYFTRSTDNWNFHAHLTDNEATAVRDALNGGQARFEAELARRLAEPPDLEVIRSNEAVRDAFVECYTLQAFISDEKKNNVTPEEIEDWAKVESLLIKRILIAAREAPHAD